MFEDFSLILSSLRKKLTYIALVFGVGAMVSFSFMGEVIKRIEYDMFWRLSLPGKLDAVNRLSDISSNISLISKEVNNSIIAQNLTMLSGEILNISKDMNLYKPNIIYLTPMEVLMLEFKMSLIFGAILASPLIFYYSYRGLKGRLRKMMPINTTSIFLILIIAVALFLIGAGYAYFFMLPLFLGYLYQDAISLGINANFSVYAFVYFIVMTTVIIGFAFELPLILNILVRSRITSRQTLSHYRKHAYIMLLIVAAWITPGPDIFSQIMVMLPFVILFELSLVVMRITGR